MKLDVVIKKLLLWIPKNIAGVLGLIQTIVKTIREVMMILLRLIAPILSFGEDGKTDDRIIKQIADIADRIDKAIEWMKDKLLVAGDSN